MEQAIELRPDTPQVAAVVPPVRRRHRGPKPRQPFDKRTLLGRRVVELAATFRARLGEDAGDPVMSTAIRRCAETVALSEDLRARMLRGEAVSADDVLRITRTADALTRRLHLDRHVARTPTLPEYLAMDEVERRQAFDDDAAGIVEFRDD